MMRGHALPNDARALVETMGAAEIVVGIPTYCHAASVGEVAGAVSAGLSKYFPQLPSVIVNCDGDSKDKTRQSVLAAHKGGGRLMLLSTPLAASERVATPYHGVRGKANATRLTFQVAAELGAKVCAIVEPAQCAMTPEWVDLLLRPVLFAGYDFVAPYYHQHKFDGTIGTGIVYPLTRALYGVRVRYPAGGDFGVSAKLLERYLAHDDWSGDTLQGGSDVWLSTLAMAEGYRVCQSFLGARPNGAGGAHVGLAAMLGQVVGCVFEMMQEYEPAWRTNKGSRPAELFGQRFDVGLDRVHVNAAQMIEAFRREYAELGEVWAMTLDDGTQSALSELAGSRRQPFRMPDEVWVRVVLEMALAYQRRRLERGRILPALKPLYLAWVASFALETGTLVAAEVEDRIERLCMAFENAMAPLAGEWREVCSIS